MAAFTLIKRVHSAIIRTNLIDSFLWDVQNQRLNTTSFMDYTSNLDPQLQWLLENLQEQEMDLDFWLAVLQSGIVE
eukprot:2793825-Ditylum_brightwellii.AAC.1